MQMPHTIRATSHQHYEQNKKKKAKKTQTSEMNLSQQPYGGIEIVAKKYKKHKWGMCSKNGE